MADGESAAEEQKGNRVNVTKYTTTTTTGASGARFTPSASSSSAGAAESSPQTFGRRPSFNGRPNRPKPPPPKAPPPQPSQGFDFLSQQDKLQQDLTAMTLKNKSVRATTQARKSLAQRERETQRKAIDEKVSSNRAQLEEEEDQWFKFLMDQREREIRAAEEAVRIQRERERASAHRTPEQRAAEAKARQERDAERRMRAATAAMTQSQSTQWAEYESKWTTFQEIAVITMAAVPWPPNAESLLQWQIQKTAGTQAEYKSKVKSAYKKCALRWHPDKFMGNFGSKMAEADKEKIHSKLNDNFQILNASLTAALKGT